MALIKPKNRVAHVFELTQRNLWSDCGRKKTSVIRNED